MKANVMSTTMSVAISTMMIVWRQLYSAVQSRSTRVRHVTPSVLTCGEFGASWLSRGGGGGRGRGGGGRGGGGGGGRFGAHVQRNLVGDAGRFVEAGELARAGNLRVEPFVERGLGEGEMRMR